MVGVPLILLSGKVAFGKIKLGTGVKIGPEELKQTSNSHRVSEDEAQGWWPDWKVLYKYPIDSSEMFKKTRPVKVPQGVQKFISNVEFLN